MHAPEEWSSRASARTEPGLQTVWQFSSCFRASKRKNGVESLAKFPPATHHVNYLLNRYFSNIFPGRTTRLALTPKFTHAIPCHPKFNQA